MFKVCVNIILFSTLLYAGDLRSLIQKALENKTVKAAEHNLAASQLEHDGLKRAYLPSFSFNSVYTDTSHENALTPQKGVSAAASVSYSFYDGGAKTHRLEALSQDVISKRANVEEIKNRLSLDVSHLYFSYLSYEAAKHAKAQELKQLQSQHKKLRLLFENQSVAKDEVEKILSRLENANVDLQEIELDMQKVLHDLEYLVGEAVTVQKGSGLQKLALEQVQHLASLDAMQADLAVLKAQAYEKKSALLPQVNLENSFNYYDYDYHNEALDSKIETQNTFRATLSWKFYDFAATPKRYEAQMKRYLALKERYEYEKNRIDVNLHFAYKAYKIAKAKLSSAKASLRSANTTYEAIEAKYQNFLVDNVAFLEALSEKYLAQSTLERARYELEMKQANIIYLSGKNIINYLKNPSKH